MRRGVCSSKTPRHRWHHRLRRPWWRRPPPLQVRSMGVLRRCFLPCRLQAPSQWLLHRRLRPCQQHPPQQGLLPPRGRCRVGLCCVWDAMKTRLNNLLRHTRPITALGRPRAWSPACMPSRRTPVCWTSPERRRVHWINCWGPTCANGSRPVKPVSRSMVTPVCLGLGVRLRRPQPPTAEAALWRGGC